MIISFKYKFIFIKTYKTAGSSIETYLYNYLNKGDIIAQTEDYKGINCWGNFDHQDLLDYYDQKIAIKKINLKLNFFPHMHIWLIKKRLETISKKLNYDIFNNFYKFGVIRNPFDLLVSDYYWRNSQVSNKKISFNDIVKELDLNTFQTHALLNINKLMDKNLEKILCDKIIKYENLNNELSYVFDRLKIPFNGKLEIFKKKSTNKRDYKTFYNNDSKKLIEDIFWKEIELFDYKF